MAHGETLPGPENAGQSIEQEFGETMRDAMAVAEVEESINAIIGSLHLDESSDREVSAEDIKAAHEALARARESLKNVRDDRTRTERERDLDDAEKTIKEKESLIDSRLNENA